MKKIFFGLLAAIILVGCGDRTAYTIKGTAKDVADDTKVFLYEDRRGKEVIDSATIKDGKFEFAGLQNEPVVRFVKLEDMKKRPWAVVIEPGANIKLDLDAEKVLSVTGTVLNDKNTEFWRILGEKDVPDSELLVSFIKENAGNVLGVYLLEANFYSYDLDQLKEVVALVPDKYKSTPEIQKIEKNIEAQEKTAVGMKFIDIKGLTPDGKELSLSEYIGGKNKIILVDFWASWCPPCIADMPHLVEAYAKYKNKGFEIVGVSIDDDNTAWTNRIKELNITWPQVSDLKGWESELSKPYAVSSIPHTILIDNDGTILGKKIKGEDLDAKLAELLK